MLKLLFCVDHLFQWREGGTVYTTGGKFPYSKWEEYLEYFDELTVVSRGFPIENGGVARLAVSSGPHVQHHLFDGRRGLRRLTTLSGQRAELRDLVAGADAVICRVPTEIGLAACAMAQKMGKPYLVEVVACPWDAMWNYGSAAAKAYAPLLARRTRESTLRAPMVHYVTDEFLQRRYPTRGIALGASDVILPAPPADLMERRRMRIEAIKTGAPITFGTIGAMITRLKGIHLAIEALARNRDRFPNFIYRVVGEGDPAPYRALAERLGIGDQVKFDGIMPPGDPIAAWADGIDVYLQPSYQEGLSRALIEAMDRGCPAIASTVGGNPELLPPARLHAVGDSLSLDKTIVDLVDTPVEDLQQEARRNFETAQRHSYPRTLAMRQQLYGELRQRALARKPGSVRKRKLLFCVDHVFQRAADGTIYTTGGKFPYGKWQEYLGYFDELEVVARAREMPEGGEQNLAIASGPQVTFHLLDDRRGVARIAKLPQQRALLAGLVAGADAVIGRVPGEIGIAGCMLADRERKPWLVELVACPWDALWNHGSPAAKAYAPLQVLRTRNVARHARLAHYVTREFLQRRYPTRGAYVCASNVVLPEPEPELLPARLERLGAWRRGDRPVVFGTIGALFTSLKGVDLAIEALAAARDRLPPFVYRVLGEGDPARLQALAEKLGVPDCVQFDGVLPGPPEVAAWLDGVDIYLQPSYQEGLPRAMIEAMGRACLAIGSTVGGIPELVPAERMHQPGDVAGLGARIEALLAADEAALAAEAAGNFEIAQRYSYARSLAEKRRAYKALRDWADGKPPVLPPSDAT